VVIPVGIGDAEVESGGFVIVAVFEIWEPDEAESVAEDRGAEEASLAPASVDCGAGSAVEVGGGTDRPSCRLWAWRP
jgi:hypothetical protein